MTAHDETEQLRLSAPSMVFGEDLRHNVQTLADMVAHVEIVVFQTPTVHNIPGAGEVADLRDFASSRGLTFSVHLPTTFEIASAAEATRRDCVEKAKAICAGTEGLEPEHYILHVPATAPTLVAIPNEYLRLEEEFHWTAWREQALKSLETLSAFVGADRLLVENINYSPRFLEPFLERDLCGLCLDLGHLLLGDEDVTAVLTKHLPGTREIHLHGVSEYVEHLSLSCVPKSHLRGWLGCLHEASYDGVVTLEVFDPDDLTESLRLVEETYPGKLRATRGSPTRGPRGEAEPQRGGPR